MVKAILIKPLDGQPAGAEREFDQHDFDRLEALGAVRRKREVAPLNKAEPPLQNKAVTPSRTKSAKAG